METLQKASLTNLYTPKIVLFCPFER